MFDVRTSRVLAKLTHTGKIFAVCCLDGLHTPPDRERTGEAPSTHKYWKPVKELDTNQPKKFTQPLKCLCVDVCSCENITVQFHILLLIKFSYEFSFFYQNASGCSLLNFLLCILS